jgi:hypothetical protein
MPHLKSHIEYPTKVQADKVAAECAEFYGLPFTVAHCSEGYFYGYHYHVIPVRPFSTIWGQQTHN